MRANSLDQNGSSAVPAGALRILARNDDREVLIVHGEDRDVGASERLAVIEWFPSIAIAEAVSRECSRLLIAAQAPLNKGWHTFPVEHLPKLVRVARNHLNFTYAAAEPERREKTHWSEDRIFWFGVRWEQGWLAQAIAEDQIVKSTPEAVRKKAQRLGIQLSARPRGQVHMRLPATVLAVFEAEAERQGITRDALIARAVIAAAPSVGRACPV